MIIDSPFIFVFAVAISMAQIVTNEKIIKKIVTNSYPAVPRFYRKYWYSFLWYGTMHVAVCWCCGLDIL